MYLERPVFTRSFVQFQARFKQKEKWEKKKIPLWSEKTNTRKETEKEKSKGKNQKYQSARKDKQAGMLPFSEGAVPKIIRMRWWAPTRMPTPKSQQWMQMVEEGEGVEVEEEEEGTHVCSSTQAKPLKTKMAMQTLATGLEEIRTQYDLFWRRSDDHQQSNSEWDIVAMRKDTFVQKKGKKTFTWKSSIRQSHGSHARNFKVWRRRNDWMFQDPSGGSRNKISDTRKKHFDICNVGCGDCLVHNFRTGHWPAVLRTTRLSIEWTLCIIQRKWLRWFRWWSKVGSAWPSVPDKSIRLDTIVVLNAQPVLAK